MAPTRPDSDAISLRGLDQDTYGTCAVCGRATPQARLDALPHATTCVDHQPASRHQAADTAGRSTR